MLRRKFRVTSAKTNLCNICANNARCPEHFYFAQMLHRNKNTDVTQKIPRNICENESV